MLGHRNTLLALFVSFPNCPIPKLSHSQIGSFPNSVIYKLCDSKLCHSKIVWFPNCAIPKLCQSQIVSFPIVSFLNCVIPKLCLSQIVWFPNSEIFNLRHPQIIIVSISIFLQIMTHFHFMTFQIVSRLTPAFFYSCNDLHYDYRSFDYRL